jgi:hypothetical protein
MLTKKSSVLFILFTGVIPAILILIGGYPDDLWEDLKLWFEAFAFYLSIWALVFAEKAARKSQETEEQLIKYGLSNAENQTNFTTIFHEHLVNQLGRFTNNGGRIYLLLSTPAYGYAVVGPQQFAGFVKALRDLGKDCSVELIFFSPDDHYHYWANVLVWSAIRSKDEKEHQFSENFFKGIEDVFVQLRAHHWKLWVTKSTTVREFAFFPAKGSSQKGSYDSIDRIYLVLTDPFSISQDQFQAGFQARSIRIPSFGRGEYVGAQGSYFERIKVCPYTGIVGDDVVLITDENHLLSALEADYVLGRTNQKLMSLDTFHSEMYAMLHAVSVANHSVENNQVLSDILSQCLSYYHRVLQNDSIKSRISPTQGNKICVALKRSVELLNEESAKELVDFILETLGTSGADTSLAQCNPTDIPAIETEILEAVKIENEIISCIYELLSSGFEESEYAVDRIHKNQSRR